MPVSMRHASQLRELICHMGFYC